MKVYAVTRGAISPITAAVFSTEQLANQYREKVIEADMENNKYKITADWCKIKTLADLRKEESQYSDVIEFEVDKEEDL